MIEMIYSNDVYFLGAVDVLFDYNLVSRHDVQLAERLCCKPEGRGFVS
jgi:hypothetical protein